MNHRGLIVVSLALAAGVAAAFATDNRRGTTTRERGGPERNKLLVIVIDG